MLIVTVDTSAMLGRIDVIAERLEQFGPTDMPAEVTEWQREDMNRQYPKTETPDSRTAFTRIWPRSRLSVERRAVRRQQPRRTGRPLPVLRTPLRGGERPILRPELLQMFYARMRALLPEKIHW
jgi:hypothetical protein